MEESPLSVFHKGTTSKLAGFSSHFSLFAERQAEKLWNTHFFKKRVFLVWPDKGIERFVYRMDSGCKLITKKINEVYICANFEILKSSSQKKIFNIILIW